MSDRVDPGPERAGAGRPDRVQHLRPLEVTGDGGTAIAAYELGPPDAPLVVLCHGIGLDRHSWGEVPGLLARRRRVVVYDLRGHGESGPAARGDYSMPVQGRDLRAVIEAAQPGGGRVALVGHSLGGGVLLGYVHVAGEDRVSAAVFLNTSGAAKLVPLLPMRGARGRFAAAQRELWLVAFRTAATVLDELGDRPRVARGLLRRVAFGTDPPPDDVRFVHRLAEQGRTRPLAATMRATVALDPVRWAESFTRPALVLAGNADMISPVRDARRLAEALPAGRLLELDGAGHLAALTRPEEVARRISAFLDEAGA